MRMLKKPLRRASLKGAAWLFPLLLLAAASLAPAQTKGNIAAFAGYGNLCADATDNVGDGCPANSARLAFPYGLAIDKAGSLIIADNNHYRLRKVDATSKIISVLAGTGDSGTTWQGVQATTVRVNPYAVALNYQGNYYISQSTGISTIDATTGAMTLFAGGHGTGYAGDGGPATLAKIYAGTGAIVFDHQQNLYIADQLNNVVRKVAYGTGIITTVAGKCVLEYGSCQSGYSGDYGQATNALLNYPTGLAFDGAGNLYIGDSNNFVIRKVAAGTNIITTIAGTGKPGYSGDGGKATAAQLNSPGRMTFDPAGNLYFSDGHVIRKIDAAGKISTVVGNGKPGLVATTGDATSMPLLYVLDLAFDANQNLLFTDNSYRVYRVDAKSHQVAVVAGDAYGCKDQTDVVGDGCPALTAQTVQPVGMINSGGALLFADLNDPRIRRIDLGTGLMSTVLGTGFLDYTGDKGPAGKATLAEPYDVAQDGAGNLFVADQSGLNIRRVDAKTGIITTMAGNGQCDVQDSYGNCFSGDNGPATEAELYYASGIASDWAGNLFIADTDNSRIRRVDAKTGIITTVAGDGNCNSSGDGGPAAKAELCYPTSVRLDNAGNIYFPDEYNGVIRRIDAKTGIIATVAGNPNNDPCTGAGGLAVNAGDIFSPYGMALDGANNLFFVDGYCGTISRVDAVTGILTIVAGPNTTRKGHSGDGGPATQALISNDPWAIAFDKAGNLFFSDTRNRVIREIYGIAAPLTAPAPTFTPAAGNHTSPFSVTLADPIVSAAIYYTTDGSTPSPTHGTKYANPIPVTAAETIKAIAVVAGYADSAVASAAYTFLKVQTITFPQPTSPVTYGVKPITLSAKASSGLAVTFSVVWGPGKVVGSTLTITGVGTVVVAANQAGNSTYLAAPQVTRNITVNKASQIISFTQPPSPVTYGVKPIALSATATSGLAVTFSVVSGPAKVAGSTLTITGAGTVVVAADQAGNMAYTAAPQVKRNITVQKALLTASADNKNMKKGGAVPALTYTLKGFVNGDTQAKATSGKPALSTTATSQSAVGSYPITIAPGSLAATNYSLILQNGVLTVTN